MEINRCNLVWGPDSTSIRLNRGWLYLVAIMDWFSRSVPSWALATSLEADFCHRAWETALALGLPEIFTADQGSQVTSLGCFGNLPHYSIRIIIEGRGRALDNSFTERLWRAVN